MRLDKKEQETDFGFKTYNKGQLLEEFESEAEEKIQEAYANNTNQRKAIYDLIAPFLENLRDARGDYIHWPELERRKVTESVLTKLGELTGQSWKF